MSPKNDAAIALAEATQQLQAVSDTARLDAELLLAHALGLERGAMLLTLRDLDVPTAFTALIERRLAHEPVAYIIGRQAFWDLDLEVNPAVLIPRADSETLIEAAQDYFAGRQPSRVLDLGTGSGALLLAALSLFPKAEGLAIDASPAALRVASSNAARLGFTDRAQFIHASWRDADWMNRDGMNRDCPRMGTVPNRPDHMHPAMGTVPIRGQSLASTPFDLILCNPPYVETQADLARQVRDYEPASALFAGEDGLDDYNILIPQIPALLAPGGVAIFEIGKGQEMAVSNLAANSGLSCTQHKDLAGIIRAISMILPASG
jgi:release factor glutamine methyltransferase